MKYSKDKNKMITVRVSEKLLKSLKKKKVRLSDVCRKALEDAEESFKKP